MNPNRAPHRPGNPVARLVALLALGCSGCLAGCGGGVVAQDPPIHYLVRPGFTVADEQFRRTLGNLLGPPLLEGNAVQSLRNGDEIFPAMLAAIRGAEHTIDLETFIYWSGQVGREFTDALAERAAAGVKVHVIIDWVGAAKIDRGYVKRLRDAGADVVQYHPLHWYDFTSAARLNNRTHRKLLVVDGAIGFTGGVGIADAWSGRAESPEHWRDMHYRIEGPAVAQLQAAFLDNWMKTTGHVLDGPHYFPPLPPKGKQVCQVFKSGAQGGSESMELLYLLSLAAAKTSVRIGNAYFIPDRQTIDAMLDARRRGVRIQIIVPGPHIDEQTVRHASRARWGELLKAGVEIYEYQPTMYHTKLLVVDELWTSIGSSNLDNRSFRLNDEANLNVLDPTFGTAQAAIFDEDLTRAKPITYEQWLNRPWPERFMEGAAQLLTPLL